MKQNATRKNAKQNETTPADLGIAAGRADAACAACAAETDATIREIARTILRVETFEERVSEHYGLLNVHLLTVWQIREALEAAFEAGRNQAR